MAQKLLKRPTFGSRRIHTRKIDRLVARNHMTALGMNKRAKSGKFFAEHWREYAADVQ